MGNLSSFQSSLFRPLIWVEGIIGCGKTTFCREVGKRLELRVIEELTSDLRYLEAFYEAPKERAFGFQIAMLGRRYMMQRLAADEASSAIGEFKGAILDRSLSGDRVFARLHMKAGNIHPLDWESYEHLYNIMARTLLPPTLLVFLDVQPETAFERMRRRGRKAENEVTLDYLVQLHDGYQELLAEAERGLLPWAHAVRISRLVFDPDTIGTDRWDAVAKTVLGACRGHEAAR